MVYKIEINNNFKVYLHLSGESYWLTPEARFPINRHETEMPNWGPEVTYTVSGPDDVRAVGSCSNHDGCGVSTPDGEWGFERLEEDVMLLGEHSRLEIDRENQQVVVGTAEPLEMLPYIICGLCILLDGR
jgi:hypothetical protein